MYLAGVPPQDQVIVPEAVLYVGVMVMVTPCPIEVEAVLPLITMTPALLTEPPEILPVTLKVKPEPAFAVSLSVWNFSEIAVR